VTLIANCSEIIFRLGKLQLEHDTASIPSFPVEMVAKYLIECNADADFDFVENQGGGGDWNFTEFILSGSVVAAKKMLKDKNGSAEKLAVEIRRLEEEYEG
jgi:hypothetical protein